MQLISDILLYLMAEEIKQTNKQKIGKYKLICGFDSKMKSNKTCDLAGETYYSSAAMCDPLEERIGGKFTTLV